MTDTAVATIAGFVAAGRYRRVECDWLTPQEGAEPLWVEVRADLPFAALDDLPLAPDDAYQDLWRAIAPHVRAWNALGLDIKSGEYRPVPPPAEIGLDAFRAVDPMVGIWIGQQLKLTYRQAVTGPKSVTVPSNSGPSVKASSEDASVSTAPEKSSRKNRTATAST